MKKILASAFALAALAGCGPHYDHLAWNQATSPPLSVQLTTNGVSIPEGIAVAVKPVAMDGDSAMDDAVVDLVSSDERVLGLDPAYGEKAELVLYGVSVGHATINVFVDGEPVGSMVAVVTAQ